MVARPRKPHPSQATPIVSVRWRQSPTDMRSHYVGHAPYTCCKPFILRRRRNFIFICKHLIGGFSLARESAKEVRTPRFIAHIGDIDAYCVCVFSSAQPVNHGGVQPLSADLFHCGAAALHRKCCVQRP